MYPFGRWPIGDVPRAAAGVYTIWGDDELVYVGMSGRGLTAAQIAQPARDDLRIEIVTWIERTYHHRRRQTRLGRLTPIEYEMIMTQQTAAAA